VDTNEAISPSETTDEQNEATPQTDEPSGDCSGGIRLALLIIGAVLILIAAANYLTSKKSKKSKKRRRTK
ncbi:MAG: hypothetical protein LUH54_05665, partial [Firmicutes bacterium]|nr:hypothetical protein [Bacillota bacterium]